MSNFPISRNNIFLIDSIGAFLTAFLLYVVLAGFEEIFGMPREPLYFLSLMATGIGLFSLFWYFKKSLQWRTALKVILVVNILYGLMTIILVIKFFHSLTIYGKIYFLLELSVMSFVIFKEVRILTQD